MEKIVQFIGENYAWFLTITILLLFALIGYIYDTKKSKNDLMRKSEEELDATSLEKIMENSEFQTDLEQKSLNDMVSKSKNINPETKSVEVIDETPVNNTQNNINPE